MTLSATENSSKKPARKPPKKITEDYLHNAGLHYLGRFAASSAQFRRVMMRKIERSCRFHADQDRASCARMIEDLITKFTRAGLLDDDVYKRGLIDSLRRRGFSERAIAAKLAVRGLTSDSTQDTGNDLRAAALQCRRKRLGPFSARTEKEKDLAKLARAGFDYETAQRVLSMTMDEIEDLLRSEQ